MKRRQGNRKSKIKSHDDDDDDNDDIDIVHPIHDDVVDADKFDDEMVVENFENEEDDGFARDVIDDEAEDDGFNDFAHGTHTFVDFSDLPLKPDHSRRPLWVCPNLHIYLETFSKFYKETCDFLVAIANPLSRTELMHEYILTDMSLFAAVSINLTADYILDKLELLSKVKIPESVASFVRQKTRSFGLVKLVLKQSRLFVESPQKELLDELLKRDGIRNARLVREEDYESSLQVGNGNIFNESEAAIESDINRFTNLNNIYDVEDDEDQQHQENGVAPEEEEFFASSSGVGNASKSAEMEKRKQKSEILASPGKVLSFEIKPSDVEVVRREAKLMGSPLMDEYDYRNDMDIALNVPITLKSSTTIRPHQGKSLSKVFGNGRARSGIVVLPCGAGKTLVGITACSTMKKSALILCNSGLAVDQWKQSFKIFTDIDPKRICLFKSKEKGNLYEAKPGSNEDGGCIVISTYQMFAQMNRASEASKAFLNKVQSRPWGLLVLDEVHMAPTDVTRKVLTLVKAHCKLGLTATLVREDKLIDELSFLVGPKLYEANWIDLTEAGYLSRVLCSEVWCPMDPDYYAQYLNIDSGIGGIKITKQGKRMLEVLNPNKILACEYLMRLHEDHGDKVLIFCDDIAPAELLSKRLGRQILYGKTNEKERERILREFMRSPVVNTIILTRVGDTAIDIPASSVIIQISSHFGSRRQQAQRLGRILRPKTRSRKVDSDTIEYHAFFYSLISKDTEEARHAVKRQSFLMDQGYAFRVITTLSDIAKSDEAFKKRSTTGALFLEENLRVLEGVLRSCAANTEDEATKKFGDFAQKAKVEKRYEGKEPLTLTKDLKKTAIILDESDNDDDDVDDGAIEEEFQMKAKRVRREGFASGGNLIYREYSSGYQ